VEYWYTRRAEVRLAQTHAAALAHSRHGPVVKGILADCVARAKTRAAVMTASMSSRGASRSSARIGNFHRHTIAKFPRSSGIWPRITSALRMRNRRCTHAHWAAIATNARLMDRLRRRRGRGSSVELRRPSPLKTSRLKTVQVHGKRDVFKRRLYNLASCP